jgi:hypothetical protein
MPTYTQLAQDTFIHANQNPIDAAHWTTFTPGFADLQILSNKCLAAATGLAGAAYTGISWPANQYAEITIAVLSGAACEADIILRSSADGNNCYDFGIVDNGDGTAFVFFESIVGGFVVGLFQNAAVPFSAGDIFRASALGTTISFFQNGILLGSAIDSAVASGNAGVSFFTTTLVTEAQLSNFAGGSVSSGTLDTIGNGIARPAMIYGRAPNGVMSAVTTDGSGNIDLSGQTPSLVDTLGNSICTPVMIYGRAPDGTLQAVTTDGDGQLNQ